ncbi:MAG TPA: hypothetical protein VGN83_10360 [Falsiroseomonas sp.]|jgi:hypothetical protein|nr:hypothetical protein [Falsiroseomonas sp.]
MAGALRRRVRNDMQLVRIMLTGRLTSDVHQDENASVNAIIRRVTVVPTVQDNGISGLAGPAGSRRHGAGPVRRLLEQVQGTATLLSNSGTRWVFRVPVALPTDEPSAPTGAGPKASQVEWRDDRYLCSKRTRILWGPLPASLMAHGITQRRGTAGWLSAAHPVASSVPPLRIRARPSAAASSSGR